MANFYNAIIPRPTTIPATVEVRIFAGRVDGGDLTAEELAALRATYPNAAPAEAPAGKTKPIGKPKPRTKASGTKPAKPSTKRVAARRPDHG